MAQARAGSVERMEGGLDSRASGGPLKRCLLALLLLECALLPALPLHAAAARQGPEERTITAVIPADFPPTYYREKGTGRPAGFAVDLLDRIAARANLRVSYIFANAWDEIVDDLKSGKADVIPNLGISGERERDFAFTTPLEVFTVSLFVRSNASRSPALRGGARVAVIESSIAFRYLEARPEIRLVTYQSFPQGLFALLSGEVDAFACPTGTLLRLARDAGVDDRIRTVGKPLIEVKRAIAVRKDQAALLQRLDEAIDGFVGSPEYEAIYQKWFGKPKPFWTVGRIVPGMAALVFLTALAMAAWRYRSVSRLNRELRMTITEKEEAEGALRRALEQAEQERAKTESIVAGIGEGIVILDPDFHVLYQNQVHRDAFGDHVGERCYKAYHGRTEVCDGCPIAAAYGDGAVHRTERSVPRGGETVYFEDTASSLRDSEGNVIAGIEILRDVTDRKRSSERIEFLASIIEAIPDAVCSIDVDGAIRSWNEGARVMLGYAPDEILGKPIATVIPEEIVEAELLHCIGILDEAGSFTGYESVRLAKDGRRVPVEMVGVALKDGNRRAVRYASIMRDITERKRLEEEHLKTVKLESLSVLAGGIAHDFNNLLTAILGNLSLAQAYTNGDSRVSARLGEAEKASLRAKDLTQQLLTFSKGGVPIKKVVSIAELVRGAAALALSGSNVQCKLSMSSGVWPVEADEGQISQVVHNLMINAQQAMPNGGTITLGCENVSLAARDGLPVPEGSYVRLTVEDAGVGIEKKHLSRIFDPYFTTKQKGNGLGLATSFSIVKRHGGHITVASEAGEGTTVSVYLPALEGAAVPARPPERETFEGKGRILVMDDEEIVREVVGQMLVTLGYEAAFAKEGAEAIEAYRAARGTSHPFQAVIMDLTIPGGMGGREAVEELRTIDPEAKVLVSSGYSNDPIMAEHEKYGFAGVVAKPYRLSELGRTLRDVIAGAPGA